jgi:acyl-coenzyme A synthetase/AMP-(fatty) acid ligase
VDVLARLRRGDHPALHVEGAGPGAVSYSELIGEIRRRAATLRDGGPPAIPDRTVWHSAALSPAEQLTDLLAALQAGVPALAVNRAWWPREQAAVEQLFADHPVGGHRALWLASSGTTGEPTPYGFSAEQVAGWWADPLLPVEAGARVVVSGDVGHGPVLRVALAALAGGAELRFAGRSQLGGLLHRDHVDLLCTTPILLRRTLRQLARHRRSVRGVRGTVLHQGDVRPHEAASWPTILGGTVWSAVSSTEAGGWITFGDVAPGVSWSAAPDASLRVSGPAVASARLDRPAPAHGWLTGDVVEQTAPLGALRLRSRPADHFLVDGVSVDPAVVERAVARHPLVADVAVVPRPHPERQHLVVAVIVPADPEWPPFLDDLVEVTAELEHEARPTALAIAGDLPTNAAGALSRRLLTYDEAGR